MKRWRWAIGALAVVVLGVGWWLLSPLFLNRTVNEAAPGMAAEAMMKETAMDGEMKDDAMDGAAMKADGDADKMGSSMPSDDMKDAEMKETDMKSQDMKDTEMKDQGMMDTPMKDQAMMDNAMKDDAMGTGDDGILYAGAFRDGDASHHAEGRALVIAAEGRTYLRLEDFRVTNGPDLFVYLVRPGDPVAEGISLGKLKGNIGNQNYEIPAGTDLMAYTRAVIWCRAFDVTFGTADLAMGS